MKPLKIYPDELSKLKFSKKDVCTSPGERVNRELNLKAATLNYKLKDSKTNIIIESKHRGPIKVQIKVANVAKKHIITSKGLKVPIKSIHHIKF